MKPGQRFFSKVAILASGCWEWTAGLRKNGYGQFWDGTSDTPAHRWAYQHLRGTIPPGLESDHLCRNRQCVNPWHIELVTHEENVRRGRAGYNAEKTHCPQGHPYSGENLIERPSTDGYQRRGCLICQRVANAKYARSRGKAIP